jgi:hypothetical protein
LKNSYQLWEVLNSIQDNRIRTNVLNYLGNSLKSIIKNGSDIDKILNLFPQDMRTFIFKDLIIKESLDFSILNNEFDLMSYLKCFSEENRLAMFNCIPVNKKSSLLNNLLRLIENEDSYVNINSTNPYKWLESSFLELGMEEAVSNMKYREINAVSRINSNRSQRFFIDPEEVKKNETVAGIGMPAQSEPQLGSW